MIILLIVIGMPLIAYVFLLMKLARGLSGTVSPDSIPSAQQFVSVIICMHNEAHNIPGLISSLAQQDYPENLWEIIIVNDRSSDGTADLLLKYAAETKKLTVINVTETCSEFSPKKFAIDLALTQARGPVILLTDADGRPGPSWITSMCSHYSPGTGMVIGYAPYMTDPPYQKFIFHILALEYMSHACIAAATTALGFPLTCVGTNISYPKAVYTELAGFGKYKNYHSGDDDLFMQRVRDESPWKIIYAYKPASHVYNAPPSGWKQFLNQRLRYASKGFLYPGFITAGLIGYFFFNVMLLLLPLAIMLDSRGLLIFISTLLIKSLAEYILLSKFASLTDHKKLLKYFIPAVFLHIPYIVFFGLFGSILKYKWGGINR